MQIPSRTTNFLIESFRTMFRASAEAPEQFEVANPKSGVANALPKRRAALDLAEEAERSERQWTL